MNLKIILLFFVFYSQCVLSLVFTKDSLSKKHELRMLFKDDCLCETYQKKAEEEYRKLLKKTNNTVNKPKFDENLSKNDVKSAITKKYFKRKKFKSHSAKSGRAKTKKGKLKKMFAKDIVACFK